MISAIISPKIIKNKPFIKQFLASGFCLICLIALSQPAYAYYAKSSESATAKGDYPTYPNVNYGTGKHAKLIKRGEYLTRMGDCIACHTDTTSNGPAFAGDLPIKTPFGTFYSPNITPDPDTGIGRWTLKDFMRSMHEGKSANGSNLFPVYPYLYFSRVSDDDVRAIWAYLHVLPPIKKAHRKNTVPFPFSWRFAQYGWKLLYFYRHNDRYQYNPEKSAAWNRGAYIVQGLGHCSMCHTPLSLLGGPKRKNYLTGSFIDGFWAANITSAGLESVSVDEIVNVFKKSKLPHEAGRVVGPMAEVTHNSLSHLTENDMRAIAVYLKTVVSKDPLSIRPDHKPATLARGKKIYYRVCSTCHQEGKESAPIIGDSANWNQRAQQGRRVLYRNTINGYNLMPIKGDCVTCNRQDIEAAVDFLINKSLTREQLKAYNNPKPQQKTPAVVGKQIYQTYCSICHNKGRLGAPILGDKKAWAPLIAKNMDILIENTLRGSHSKAPKGGCEHCNTADVIAAIKYMVKEGKTKGNYSLW